MTERLSSNRRAWSVAIVAIAAMAALIAAALAYRRGDVSAMDDGLIQLPTKSEWDEQREPLSSQLDPKYRQWDDAAFRVRAAREAQSLVRKNQLDADSADRVVDNARTVLDLFYNGEVSPLLEMYRRQGLTVPRDLEDPSVVEWKTASIAGQNLDLAAIRVLHVDSSSGIPVLDNLPGERIMTAVPAEMRGPNDIDLTGNDLANVPMVGVVVPTILRSIDGKWFEGVLVLYFAQRRSDGEWILFMEELRSITVPEGTPQGSRPPVFMPPF